MKMRREFAVVSFKEHCFAKNTLESSTFSLKSVTNLFAWNNGGIRGTFLLFQKRFNRDQYVLKFL